MGKKKIVVFSGAGISKESGIETFRGGKNSTWNNVDVETVATVKAWKTNRDNMLDFYNARRSELDSVEPNLAHELIAKLEEKHDVTVITQNVDDLHERAGSTNILHLHGELRKMREVCDPTTLLEYSSDISDGDKGPQGTQLRPHIVWFGEMPFNMQEAWDEVSKADIMIIIGTSLEVAPACFIIEEVKSDCKVYQINPTLIPIVSKIEVLNIPKIATEGMSELIEILNE